MTLFELTSADKDRYNQFIVTQSAGTFLQSWEWGQWQETFGNKPHRFCLVSEQGQWLAAWQSLEMRLPLGGFYLYAPYGPVFTEGENFKFLTQELQKHFPGAMFARFEPQIHWPSLAALGRKSVNIQPAITMVVNVGLKPDRLLEAMHPKTRYNIKVAQRHGVTVEHELAVTPQYGLYIQEAVELIVQTQRRQKYHGHSESYYKRLIDFFAIKNFNGALELSVYRALHQKKLLACGIMMDFGQTRTYLFGGSSDEQRSVMAPYLLHWQAMQDARAAGLLYYDLGGSEVASGGQRGFTRFKQGFGGRVVNFMGAYDVIFRPWQYGGYKLVRQCNRLLRKAVR